jgi:hypothetical protein
LISIFSCKENKVVVQEKITPEKINNDKLGNEVQKIGDLYQPEKMEFKERKVGAINEKENYQISLTKSDLLDNDIKNLKTHSNKIVSLYFKFLNRTNSDFIYDKIIVNIIHRNGEIDNFKYSEKELIEILTKISE